MYGLLLESVQFYVIKKVGEEMWEKILEHAGYKNIVFTTHNTYKDEIMTQLAKSCCHVTKTKDFNQWMTYFGNCFVDFWSGYGYDKLVRVSGRNYRDFLHEIDNIHEVIRFSYPRLQSPAFLVSKEDNEGCVLLYQSKRRGFKHYVIGQLQQIAKLFYRVTVNISVIEETIVDNQSNVLFRLDFDNSAFQLRAVSSHFSGSPQFSTIHGDTFLKVFPFCIVFNSGLVIKQVGKSLAALLKGDNMENSYLHEKFHIRRPLIPCLWSKLLQFQRVVFELEYIFNRNDVTDIDLYKNCTWDSGASGPAQKGSHSQLTLLRGQMKYIKEWDMIAFLGNPMMSNLQDLQKGGLFINDLNMFDNSRDMVVRGCLHASKLEHSIEEQREKCKKISENMEKIEEWKQRSDSLLYSMIPQSVAGMLKAGADPISTCEVFDNVTIMFSYMVGFGEVCSQATPMEIVKIINRVYILFDRIIDKYKVFKVETLGDAVYMVAGGVPDRSPHHAINVAALSMELKHEAENLNEPWQQQYQLNSRIGIHSGSVVGGVVGRRMPQYCLFGDTVNTASRMQTYSLPGRIHISETCRACLKGSKLVTILRGTVNVKGKGDMRTYWLAGWEGEESTKRFIEEVRIERNEHVRQFSSYENALDLHGMHASTSYTQLAANFSRIRQDSSKTGSHVQLPSLDSKQGEISTKEGLLSRPSSRCSLGNTELSMGEIASGKSLTCSTMEFFSSPPKPTFTITSPECESPKKLSFPALNGSENEMCINNAMISHPQNTSAKADNRIEVTEVKLDIKDVWRTLDSGLCCINEDRKSESLSNMSELNPQNSCYVQSKAFKINERDDDLENANINSVPKSDYSTEIYSPVSNTLFVCAKGTVEPTGHINMSQKGRFSLSRFKLKLPDMSHLHKLFNFCHFLKQTNPITGSKPIEAKTVDDLLLDNTNLSESKNERTVDNNSFVAAESRLRASNLNIYSNQSGTDSKDDVAGGELDIVKKDEGHVQNKILKRQPLYCESVSDTNQPLTMEHLRLDDGNKSLDQAGKDWLSSTPSTNWNPAEKESPSLKPNSTNGNLAEKDWPSLKPSTNGNLNKPYNNNHKLQGHIIQGSAQMDFRKEKGHTKSESAREILPEPHICRCPFSAMNTKFHGDLKTNRDSKLFLKTKCIIPYSLKSVVKHEMSQEECIGQNDTIIHNNQSKKACACSCCCHQVPNNSINDTLLPKQINSKECLEIPLTVGQHGSQVVDGQVENAFSEETCQKVVFSLSDEE